MGGVLQAPSPEAGAEADVEPGALEIRVVNACDGSPIVQATITVDDRVQRSNAAGMAAFPELPPLGYDIEVEKKFLDGKYATFLVHYPRVMWEGKTESRATVAASLEPGQTASVEVQLVVYRLIDDITFRRKHIVFNAGPGEDKYGHWWTVMGGESYGWWPKYRLGDEANRSREPPTPPQPPAPDASTLESIAYMFAQAIHSARLAAYNLRESAPMQTFLGVEGELNGITSFGGQPTRDPHAMEKDPGDEIYSPILDDGRSDAEIKQAMREYAQSYTGGWSWFLELGNHCHTFQKGLMTTAELHMFKVIK
jgi:hypothetical protein